MNFSAWAARGCARYRAVATATVLFGCLAGPSVALDESTSPVDKSDWETGWHVVRPGDTLEGLAQQFLGSNTLWRELHLLNLVLLGSRGEARAVERHDEALRKQAGAS